MKTKPSLNAVLAGVGACALLIYVLACATSFSPDDRQVLYPSFDPQSGAMSVAVYDRKTGRSETLFVAASANFAAKHESVPLRAEWLPDGKHVLVVRSLDDSGLDVLVLPRGASEPVRQFILAKTNDAAESLEFPFALAGSRLFLNSSGQNPLRLDLVTGELAGGGSATNEIFALPSPDGKSLIGLRDLKGDTGMEFGTFDPQTMQFNVMGQTGTNASNGSLPAFNPADGRLILISTPDKSPQLEVRKDGRVEFTRALTHGSDKLEVGPFLELARDGKTVLTAYFAFQEAATNSEYGLLEIPLTDAPPRFTPLFTVAQNTESDLLYAQPSLSHDGKTWAIGTALLYAQNDSLKSEDCALFLVDLSKSSRPVTKVPIPVPAERNRMVK